MSEQDKNGVSRHCPGKSHRCHRARSQRWARWSLAVAGLVSLAWFLVRVIPKPSRAAYPCQRAAAPLASAFVVWLLGVVASAVAATKAKEYLRRSRYAVAAVCVASGLAALWLTVATAPKEDAAASVAVANQPIGVAKGIHPGRVVWVHDPDATNWAGPGDGHWWEANHTDQAVVDRMMREAICRLTGEEDLTAAWDKLFRFFNKAHGKGDVGYRPGEKIAIKVNLVGLITGFGAVDSDRYVFNKHADYMNASPQMMKALLGQLVRQVGVKESDITIGDTLAYFTSEYYDILHAPFPGVHCLDRGGKFGRVAAKSSKVPFYWSCRPKNVLPDFAPAFFAEADYLINMANLKAHTGAGVTLTAKNHYGSMVRTPVEKGYYDMHPDSFGPGTGKYRPLVDLIGHAQFGGKTMLYLVDGLYSGRHPIDKAPSKWKSAPFNGDWTSSLLASQDPVAIDSVGYDFLAAEFDDYPHKSGTEDYLHEAALADHPPSGTFYDPNHADSTERLESLGVHEHWNNPQEKRYSRNLGTGQGIELVAVGP